MASIFTLENVSDFSEKLNIDELYEKKRQYDLNKLEVYNKILNRIHVRIKTTSKKQIEEQCCWFVVPEIIIGVPKYDQGTCIAYLMDKLKENGLIDKFEKGLQSNSDLILDFSDQMQDENVKNFYYTQLELLEFSHSLKQY